MKKLLKNIFIYLIDHPTDHNSYLQAASALHSLSSNKSYSRGTQTLENSPALVRYMHTYCFNLIIATLIHRLRQVSEPFPTSRKRSSTLNEYSNWKGKSNTLDEWAEMNQNDQGVHHTAAIIMSGEGRQFQGKVRASPVSMQGKDILFLVYIGCTCAL
jgi:hypothetical protein